MKIIANKIKELRMLRGITQKQLAETIGVQPVTLQRFEYGTVRPSLDTLIALADYFGVSIDYLCGRTDKPEVNK